MEPRPLGFNVLGPLQMTVDGAPVPIGQPLHKAVLARLVIASNREVTSNALIKAAWEDQPPGQPQASLHALIAGLRGKIGQAGHDPHAVLVTATSGYQLIIADDQCDVRRFHTQQEAGLAAAAKGDFELASQHLAAALNEWKGPVLADLCDQGSRFDQASGFARYAQSLEKPHRYTATRWAQAEIACRRYHTVISRLADLTAEYPLDQLLWEQWIIALAMDGHRDDALDACRRLINTLDDAMSHEPLERIRDLQMRILREEPLDLAVIETESVGALRSSQETAGAVTAVLRDTQTGEEYPVTAARGTRIGRAADNDVVYAGDAKVSRQHAVIGDIGTGYVITDISKNGVYVNGQRIGASAGLTNGAVIGIAGHRLTFETRAEVTR